MFYRVLGISYLLSCATVAWSLPSLTEQCPEGQQVISPELKLNGGYKVDRECKEIYVLPPRTGRFLVETVAPLTTLDYCPTVMNGINEIVEWDKGIAEIRSDLRERRLELTEEEKEDYMDDIKRYQEAKLLAIAHINKISNQLGLHAQVRFDIEWESLIQAYKKANPTKTVQRLPLVGSILTATLQVPSIENQLRASESLNALVSAEIPGLVSRPEILNFIDFSEERYGAITFGNTLTGSLKLNLLGACPYWKQISDNISQGSVDMNALLSSRTNSLAPYMVANLNYFYPVQTEFSYKIKFDSKEIGKLVESLVTEKNTFEASAVFKRVAELEKSSNMEIVISEGVGTSPYGELTVEEIKADIRLALVHSVLEKIASPDQGPPTLKEVPLIDDPHETEFRQKYVCEKSSSWFGLKKKSKCYSQTYTVKIPRSAIASTAQSITHNITLNAREEVKVYKTLIQAGTLGFFEEK